jgi:hypothetical protein
MSAKALPFTFLLSCVLMATSALAQEAHPAKGVWVGHFGGTPTPQNRIVLVFDYDGKSLTGVLNPGPNAIPLKVARMDITPGKPGGRGVAAVMPVFKLYIEGEGKDARGNAVTIVAEGTMANVPLPNRVMTGAWSQTTNGNTVKNNFQVARQ